MPAHKNEDAIILYEILALYQYIYKRFFLQMAVISINLFLSKDNQRGMEVSWRTMQMLNPSLKLNTHHVCSNDLFLKEGYGCISKNVK